MFCIVDLLWFSTLAQSRNEIRAERCKQLHFSSIRQLWGIAHQYKKNQLGSREDFCSEIKYLKLKRAKSNSQSHWQDTCVCVCVYAHIYKYIYKHIKVSPWYQLLSEEADFFPQNPHGKFEPLFPPCEVEIHQKTDKIQPTNNTQVSVANAYWLHLVMPPAFGEEPFLRFITLFLILHLLSLSPLSSNTLRSPPHSFSLDPLCSSSAI